jgi:hypothetical protein
MISVLAKSQRADHRVILVWSHAVRFNSAAEEGISVVPFYIIENQTRKLAWLHAINEAGNVARSSMH